VNAPPITRFGSEDEFVIRTPGREGIAVEEIVGPIRAQLEADPNVGEFEVVRTEFVGPKVGEELNRRAALAVLLSLVLVLIYLGFRFEVRFGWAAVIATAHDVLVILAFIALFRVEVSLTTVAAVLTVIGYSLNDKIVIFDRIRENLNTKGGRREDPISLINRSVNETLPRTVMTGGATIAVLISLLVFGGPVIWDFTIVLLLGIVLGTYSSIFIGAPALLEIQNRWGTKEEASRKKELRGSRGKPTVPV
jgi:preprotein translocase subunit SecF